MTPTQLWGDLVASLQELPEWQALLVVVVGSVLVAVVIHVGGDVFIRRFTRRIDAEIDDIVLGRLHPPLYVSAILVGAYLARDALALDERLAFGVEAVVLSLLTVVWAYALTRIGREVSDELTADTQRDQSVVPIFQNVWSALVAGVSIYLLLVFWRIDVTPLLASAGIAGIVVGFAARDTIANFFGSIALYSDGTYKVGDYVVIESGERGRVEDISIRSTVIRTRDDVLVTVPNSVLNSAVIVNESAPQAKYRIRCPVGVAYGSDLDHVEEIMLRAAEETDVVLEDPHPRVRFRSFGDSALEVELLAWVRHPVQRGRGTHLLNSAVYRLFTEEGVEVPFPQRDVRLVGADAATETPAAEQGRHPGAGSH
jgi:small-conductance mechanosensitive channel